jgi:hypothetical protein
MLRDIWSYRIENAVVINRAANGRDGVSGSLGSNMCIAISRGRKALCLRTSPQRTAFPQVESVSSLFLLCSVTSMVWLDLSPIWPAYSRLHNHNSSVVTAGLPLPFATARHWYDELSTVPELLSLAVVITNAPVEFENQAAPQYGLSFDHRDRQNFQVLLCIFATRCHRGIYHRLQQDSLRSPRALSSASGMLIEKITLTHSGLLRVRGSRTSAIQFWCLASTNPPMGWDSHKHFAAYDLC